MGPDPKIRAILSPFTSEERVWTGEQALALGLVDQLGGLHTALDLAKKEAGLPMEACVEIYPQRKTFLEALLSLLKSEKNDSLHEVGILETMIQPFKNQCRSPSNSTSGVCK